MIYSLFGKKKKAMPKSGGNVLGGGGVETSPAPPTSSRTKGAKGASKAPAKTPEEQVTYQEPDTFIPFDKFQTEMLLAQDAHQMNYSLLKLHNILFILPGISRLHFARPLSPQQKHEEALTTKRWAQPLQSALKPRKQRETRRQANARAPRPSQSRQLRAQRGLRRRSAKKEPQ